MKFFTIRTLGIALAIGTLIATAAFVLPSLAEDGAKKGGELQFTDVKAQSSQFIQYYRSIQLTPAQEAVKKEALEALPAPCCSDNTAYTCCCPCNMSLSIWGLSNHLIAERGWDAEQVRAKVVSWIETINPDGFSGNVCYTGGCNRPFAKNGCGGMRPGHVTWE